MDTIKPDEFRAAMRLLPGSVVLITAGRDQDISGMAVTSMSALSADPATLIVCINRSASSLPLIERYRHFGVNFLGAHHQGLADLFSGKGGIKGSERFKTANYVPAPSGVPLLADALAGLDCEVEDIVQRHTHAIVIGRVSASQFSSTRSAMIYWQGSYLTVEPSNVISLADG
jgi:flavin reductase (DIM6/NTAB) family NADH-FMN oxidoreductase RutF